MRLTKKLKYICVQILYTVLSIKKLNRFNKSFMQLFLIESV